MAFLFHLLHPLALRERLIKQTKKRHWNKICPGCFTEENRFKKIPYLCHTTITNRLYIVGRSHIQQADRAVHPSQGKGTLTIHRSPLYRCIRRTSFLYTQQRRAMIVYKNTLIIIKRSPNTQNLVNKQNNISTE